MLCTHGGSKIGDIRYLKKDEPHNRYDLETLSTHIDDILSGPFTIANADYLEIYIHDLIKSNDVDGATYLIDMRDDFVSYFALADEEDLEQYDSQFYLIDVFNAHLVKYSIRYGCYDTLVELMKHTEVLSSHIASIICIYYFEPDIFEHLIEIYSDEDMLTHIAYLILKFAPPDSHNLELWENLVDTLSLPYLNKLLVESLCDDTPHVYINHLFILGADINNETLPIKRGTKICCCVAYYLISRNCNVIHRDSYVLEYKYDISDAQCMMNIHPLKLFTWNSAFRYALIKSDNITMWNYVIAKYKNILVMLNYFIVPHDTIFEKFIEYVLNYVKTSYI